MRQGLSEAPTRGFGLHLDVREWAGLGALFAVCVALNLTKAVHVDDTAYLEIAAAILADPLHAMNALVSWGEYAQPVHELNQPHLYLWLLAGALHLFGDGDLALHAFAAPFTGLALLAFHALARRACPARPLALTALFALGPAFIPAQNLMVDVPLLGPWLLFFLALQNGDAERPPWLAATAAAAACLVKYIGLVLVVILLIDCVARRARRPLLALLVPAGALGAWSLLNWFDYGGIHLLERSAPEAPLGGLLARSLEWTVALGAALPAAFLLGGEGPALRRRCVVALAVLGGLTVAALSLRSPLSDVQIACWWGLLAANGVLCLDWIVSMTLQSLARGEPADVDGLAWTRRLALWTLGVSGFIVLFAPFVAIRHALLVVPALLLWQAPRLARVAKSRVALILLVSGVPGIWLALSDRDAAAVYRDRAPELAMLVPSAPTTWMLGHWGLQWYGRRAGMQLYDASRSELQLGDAVVMATSADRPHLSPRDRARLRLLRKIEVPATPLSRLRTISAAPWGGYYTFFWANQSPPWRFSSAPLEVFYVFLVTEPAPG